MKPDLYKEVPDQRNKNVPRNQSWKETNIDLEFSSVLHCLVNAGSPFSLFLWPLNQSQIEWTPHKYSFEYYECGARALCKCYLQKAAEITQMEKNCNEQNFFFPTRLGNNRHFSGHIDLSIRRSLRYLKAAKKKRRLWKFLFHWVLEEQRWDTNCFYIYFIHILLILAAHQNLVKAFQSNLKMKSTCDYSTILFAKLLAQISVYIIKDT